MSIYSEFKTAFFNRGDRADFSFRWKSYAYHCITYPVGNGWFVESYIVCGDSIEVIDRLADETDFKRDLLCVYADGKFYIPKAYSGFDTYLNPLEEGFFMVGDVAELHRQQFLSKDFLVVPLVVNFLQPPFSPLAWMAWQVVRKWSFLLRW